MTARPCCSFSAHGRKSVTQKGKSVTQKGKPQKLQQAQTNDQQSFIVFVRDPVFPNHIYKMITRALPLWSRLVYQAQKPGLNIEGFF